MTFVVEGPEVVIGVTSAIGQSNDMVDLKPDSLLPIWPAPAKHAGIAVPFKNALPLGRIDIALRGRNGFGIHQDVLPRMKTGVVVVGLDS